MTTTSKSSNGVSPQSGADLTPDMTREEASGIYDEAAREMNGVQSSPRSEDERSISDIAEEYGVDTIPGPEEEDPGVDPVEAEDMAVSDIYDEAGETTTDVSSDGYEVFGVAEKLKSYCEKVGIDTVDEYTSSTSRSFRRDRTGKTASESLEEGLSNNEGIISRLLG